MKIKIITIISILFTLALVFVITITIKISKRETSETQIVFFGLGKADSIYIENSSKNILIDSGLKTNKDILIGKLKSLNVRKIDYVILTHADKDHIGSASYVLDEFETGQVIQSQNIKNTNREKKIQEVIDRKQIKNIRPDKDMSFELGDMEVTIFTPKKDHYEKDNDYSLLTLIKDRELNYLFAGDAEKELLDEVLARDLPAIDIYKVPHHGRENLNSQKIISKISPKHSIITNLREKVEIDNILESEGSKIKYVFEEDLKCFSDGKKIKFY